MKIITSYSESTGDFMSHCDNSKYLELLGCGMYDLRNTSHTFICSRETGECKNYMMQILLSGQAFHTINGITHNLQAGHCILYHPNQPQKIIHYGADNPVFMWVHFYGYGASEIVSDLQLPGIHSLTNVPALKKLLLDLVTQKRLLMPNSNYLCQGHLLNFLVTLSHNFKENSTLTMHINKISPAINYMNTHYTTQWLSNQAYADMCYLSESRFSHLFKEATGVTPRKYVEQKRIDAAKELLTTSELHIAEVALSVGYEDVYYFSRVFKKLVGIAPLAYSKQQKQS